MPNSATPLPQGDADLVAELRAILDRHGLAEHPAASATLDAVTAHTTGPRCRAELLRRLPLEYEAIGLMDANGITLEVNVGAEAILGRTAQELRGVPITANVHPDDVAASQAAFQELCREPDKVMRACVRIRHRDGSWRWIECLGRNWLHRPGIEAVVVEYRDVTAQRRAEMDLRASERFHRAVFAGLPLPMLVVDSETEKVLAVNEAATRLYGAAAADFLSLTLTELGMADLLDAAGGTLRHRRVNGTTFDVEVAAHHVIYGDRPAVCLMIQDITERQAAEQRVAARESRLRTFLEHIPAIAFIKDASGRYLYGNTAWAAQFGSRPDVLIGATDYDLWPQATAELFRRSDVATLERNEPEQFIEKAVAKDGTELWFKVNKFPLPEAGSAAMLGGIVFDVSHEYQTAEAQRKSAETLRVIIEASPLAIVMLDTRLRVQLWNPAAERLFGWSAAEVLGRPYPAVDDELREDYHRLIARLLAGESFHGLEQVRRHKSGAEILILQSSAPLRDAHGNVTGIVALISDITEKRRLEKERLAFEARLQQSQKLESLGVLAGGIAHDFNNMITGMVGFIELAQQATQPAAAADYLEKARAVALRAAEITQQMLAYAGKGKFEVRPTDLNSIVLEARDLLDISVQRKGGPVRLALAPDIPMVDADAAQMTQVLLNLVLNAADAGGVGNEIAVATGVVECTSADLARAYHDGRCQPGTYVYLEINDHGTGIPPEIQAHLFEPFYTTKFLGRGLGLPAVFGIVRGHRGMIQIHSTPQGTTIRVLFPRSSTTPMPPATVPVPTSVDRRKGVILVIDDEPAVREVVVQVFVDEGFRVLDAASGAKGLELFAANADAITAVILDFSMPGMTGDAVFAAIRQRSMVPVILISGFGTSDTAGRFHQATHLTFLSKPFRVRELLHAFHQAMADAATVTSN